MRAAARELCGSGMTAAARELCGSGMRAAARELRGSGMTAAVRSAGRFAFVIGMAFAAGLSGAAGVASAVTGGGSTPVAERSSSSPPAGDTVFSSAPRAESRHRIQLVPGDPARSDSARAAAHITREARALLQAALARGYPLSRVWVDSVALGDSLELWVRLRPGPRASIDNVRFSGPHRSRSDFLERVIGFERGRSYRPEDALLALEALEDTDLYQRIDGPYFLLPAGGDGGKVELLYELEARPVNRLTGILGYSGEDERLYGYVDLALGNLFGTGRAAELRWQGQADLESSFFVSWHEPYLLGWPVSLDARLHHVLQDTIYAETTYGLDLGWFPARRWRLGGGWDWSRLVLGGEQGDHIQRETARFSLGRTAPAWYRTPRGWAGQVSISTTSGWGEDVRRGRWQGRVWFGIGRLGVWTGQDAGIVTGPDSLLRVDAFSVGGAASLRGTYEGAFRTLRYLVLRNEFGVRPGGGGGGGSGGNGGGGSGRGGRGGARFYLLADLAYLRRWEPREGSEFGRLGPETWVHSLGFGMEVPTQAGDVSLDYAVLKGSSLAQGRVHFHLTSRF